LVTAFQLENTLYQIVRNKAKEFTSVMKGQNC